MQKIINAAKREKQKTNSFCLRIPRDVKYDFDQFCCDNKLTINSLIVVLMQRFLDEVQLEKNKTKGL